jgi:hypothetical protein
VPGQGYQVHDRSRLSFQGRWYTCPGLLSRLAGKEFELYYDRRDVSLVYLFVEGVYVGEAYCSAFMGRRVSEGEAAAQRLADQQSAKAARLATQEVRARMQEEIVVTKKQRIRSAREQEKARQLDRQREDIHPAPALEQLATVSPPPPLICDCPKPNQILRRNILSAVSPFVAMKRSLCHEACCSASLQWLHRNAL